ncbi:MAG TPA: polyphosphate kinase 1 [Candidatus Latescibacteria bacterium]|nr:polyphosphate kinase 1 [Candidatus Latescibacterota bacterium]
MNEFKNPSYFTNRELSWLGFNERVLHEAKNPDNPLLERVKFLAIVANNLDEFFEIRVSGLRQQLEAGITDAGPDGLLPDEQLVLVNEQTQQMVREHYDCWNNELLPALHEADIHIRTVESLSDFELAFVKDYCHRELHPVVTPITVNPAHPFPRVVNKALCIAILLKDQQGETLFGTVQVPRLLPRLIRLPRVEEGRRLDFVFLADLVRMHIPELFRGFEIVSTVSFRLTRNSDLYLDDEEADDLLTAIEDELINRRKGDTVRLEIDADAPQEIVQRLTAFNGLSPEQVYRVRGPVNLNRLMMLSSACPRPDLKYLPFQANEVPIGEEPETVFNEIRQRDVLLHHPYDSFNPVIHFVTSAAKDPNVLAIKQTLYRTSERSPVIAALIQAAEAGKEVTVVVELKARFDEASNIRWARRLQDAGVCVVYGVVGMKTHCKLSLVIRRENDSIRRYCHFGTGNYNSSTARLYTDLGLLTCREDLTAEAAEVFNLLTTQSSKPDVKRLLVAPFNMMDGILAKIRREAEHAEAGRPARIVAKMNSLQDQRVIRALYAASESGVQIDLIIRGICCLRPGIPGVSDTIRVISIVGRFLEHSRIISFENGGIPEIYIGSADWMSRNLRRRVEVLVPVEDPILAGRIREILSWCLSDTKNAWRLLSEGSHIQPGGSGELSSQQSLMGQAKGEPVDVPNVFEQVERLKQG